MCFRQQEVMYFYKFDENDLIYSKIIEERFNLKQFSLRNCLGIANNCKEMENNIEFNMKILK